MQRQLLNHLQLNPRTDSTQTRNVDQQQNEKRDMKDCDASISVLVIRK